MKINHLRKEKIGGRQRVTATVTWENCNRPIYDVYFETEEEFSADLSLNPHAFLIACAIPAMHFGEERIYIDEPICPELREGLNIAMSWIRHWFYKHERKSVRIEAKTRLPIPRTPERAGFFFSGGVDSFATLLVNRQNFPIDHPWSIRDGFLVFGFEMDDPKAFAIVRKSLSEVAPKVGVRLIPVYTNVYLPYRKYDAAKQFDFWYSEFMGAALASVVHAFSKRITMATISTDYDIPSHKPHGSHPLLDPNYGSSDLRIFHKGIELSRFERTKLLSECEVALQNVRVCNKFTHYKYGKLNCCECEKCLRTMLALLVLGKLDKTAAFSDCDISEEKILSILSPLNLSAFEHSIPYYPELVALLKENGRHDLVRSIRREIANYHTIHRMNKLKKMTVEPLKIFDKRYLNSSLQRLKRTLF